MPNLIDNPGWTIFAICVAALLFSNLCSCGTYEEVTQDNIATMQRTLDSMERGECFVPDIQPELSLYFLYVIKNKESLYFENFPMTECGDCEFWTEEKVDFHYYWNLSLRALYWYDTLAEGTDMPDIYLEWLYRDMDAAGCTSLAELGIDEDDLAEHMIHGYYFDTWKALEKFDNCNPEHVGIYAKDFLLELMNSGYDYEEFGLGEESLRDLYLMAYGYDGFAMMRYFAKYL